MSRWPTRSIHPARSSERASHLSIKQRGRGSQVILAIPRSTALGAAVLVCTLERSCSPAALEPALFLGMAVAPWWRATRLADPAPFQLFPAPTLPRRALLLGARPIRRQRRHKRAKTKTKGVGRTSIRQARRHRRSRVARRTSRAHPKRGHVRLHVVVRIVVSLEHLRRARRFTGRNPKRTVSGYDIPLHIEGVDSVYDLAKDLDRRIAPHTGRGSSDVHSGRLRLCRRREHSGAGEAVARHVSDLATADNPRRVGGEFRYHRENQQVGSRLPVAGCDSAGYCRSPRRIAGGLR